MDVPIPVLYQQLIYPQREQMIGQQVILVHLTSSRGQELNGKLGTIVNFNRDLEECRLHVMLMQEEDNNDNDEGGDDGSTTVKDKNQNKKNKKKQTMIVVKASNVLPPNDKIFQTFMSQSQPLSDRIIIQRLKVALEEQLIVLIFFPDWISIVNY